MGCRRDLRASFDASRRGPVARDDQGLLLTLPLPTPLDECSLETSPWRQPRRDRSGGYGALHPDTWFVRTSVFCCCSGESLFERRERALPVSAHVAGDLGV